MKNPQKEEKHTRCSGNFNVDPLQFSLRPNKYYREFLWKENVLIHFTPEPEIATVRIDTLFKKREMASPSCQFQMGDLKAQEPYHTAYISIWMTKKQAISTDAFQAYTIPK